MRMYTVLKGSAIALGVAWLAACGGDSSPTGTFSTSTTPGTLAVDPPFRIASVDAATLYAQLNALPADVKEVLLGLGGQPICGVDVYYIRFWTVGAVGEATESSGAMMVPTGPKALGCSGPRPILAYAHATKTLQTFNIANITDPSNTEGLLIAAIFAAHGYIVVAPNYAGYDISTLGYHPYLDAKQQSGEMIDSLTAARSALPNTFSSATSDSGKLFITGYSQGGHVAMATLRALQAAGSPVTAAAPMSGPYALEAFADVITYGSVIAGSTEFFPLLTNSYQHAYQNVDDSSNPVYSTSYPTAGTLLPSTTPIDTIFATGLLPQTALFDISTPVVSIPNQPALSAGLTLALTVPPNIANPHTPLTPVFQAGFGDPYLMNNNFRVSYTVDATLDPDGALPSLINPSNPLPGSPLAPAVPTQGLRQDIYLNDMRYGNWAPKAPTLMCGGDADPTVFFEVNTLTMADYWSALVSAGLVSVLDVNATPAGPFAPIQQAFQDAGAAQLKAYLDSGLTPEQAFAKIIASYHDNVTPFCMVAARAFFGNF